MSDMILFDLDGTLTDSGPGITRCVQYALASFGIEEPDLEKLNCYVGPPLLESFMNFAGLGVFSNDRAQLPESHHWSDRKRKLGTDRSESDERHV